MYIGGSLNFVLDYYQIDGIVNGYNCCFNTISYEAWIQSEQLGVTESDKVYIDFSNKLEGSYSF